MLLGIGAACLLGAAEMVSMSLLMARFAPAAAPRAAIRTGTAALVGCRALVVERIAVHHPGAVRTGGEVWIAVAYGEAEVIEAGQVADE